MTHDSPEVKFDRDAVAEIVQNLIDNAEIQPYRGNRTIHVRVAATERSVTLVVPDRGPGIHVRHAAAALSTLCARRSR